MEVESIPILVRLGVEVSLMTLPGSFKLMLAKHVRRHAFEDLFQGVITYASDRPRRQLVSAFLVLDQT